MRSKMVLLVAAEEVVELRKGQEREDDEVLEVTEGSGKFEG